MAFFGAFGLGLVIGWMVYFTNRYRTGAVQFSDITALLGAVGGAAVTALFGDAKTELFGAYGLGLASGFFLYFVVLIILVRNSGGEFTWTWFLDGRRKQAVPPWEIPSDIRGTVAPLDFRPSIEDRVGRLEAGSSLAASAAPTVLAPGRSPLTQADVEKNAAIADIDTAIDDLDKIINATTDAGQVTELRRRLADLSDKHTLLVSLRLRDIVDNDNTQRALAALRGITSELKTEAAMIKQATDKLATAARVITQVDRLIGLLRGAFA